MILRNVRCMWASVLEPNTKYEPRWEIVALLSPEQAAELADQGLALKTEDDGTSSYRFKRKVLGRKKDGTSYDKKAPIVVDAAKKPMTTLIGNGSLVNIQYEVKSFPIMGTTYIVGDLQGVQVLEHVPFKGSSTDGAEFDDEGETAVIEGDSDSTIEDTDDDIPF